MPLQNHYWTRSEEISSFSRRETLDWRWSILFNFNRHWTFDIASALHQGPDIATDGINRARLGPCHFWTSESLDPSRLKGSHGDYPGRTARTPSRARPTKLLSAPLSPPSGSCSSAHAGATGTRWGSCYMKLKLVKKSDVIGRYRNAGLFIIKLCSHRGGHEHGGNPCGQLGKVPMEKGWQSNSGKWMKLESKSFWRMMGTMGSSSSRAGRSRPRQRRPRPPSRSLDRAWLEVLGAEDWSRRAFCSPAACAWSIPQRDKAQVEWSDL